VRWVQRHLRRRVVYTCLFGYSEPFNDFVYDRHGIDEFICFTDDPSLKSDFWRITLVNDRMLDAPRASKRIKHLPHRYLSDFDESLYLDNTVHLNERPSSLFDAFLRPTGSPLVLFRHPDRQCVYDEADEVVRLRYDEPARIRRQMRIYETRGYPRARGLSTAPFLLRRHRDPVLVEVMENWFEQILLHSLRDQLSLDVVMWLRNFTPDYIPDQLTESTLLEWPVVRPGATRVPRDFDDEQYLSLHPDVAAGKLNPRLHFIEHGYREGRPYRT
jgi:hypothetical protein